MYSKCFMLRQEVQTIPCGPAETAELWRGGSRLGLNTMAIIVWMAGKPRSHFTYCTRVLEKPALLTCAILNDLFEKLRCKEYLVDKDRVVLWSDVGPHYRSRRLLASAAYIWPQRYKLSYTVCWGLEQHFKNPVDGYFSRLSRRKSLVARHRWIYSIADLLEVYESAAKDKADLNSPEFFYDWMPPPRGAVPTALLTRASLSVGVKASHCYSFTLVDARRNSLRGKGAAFSTITGVQCRAHVLPGLRSEESRTSHPVLEDEEVGEELNCNDEGECEQQNSASAIGCGEQIVNGWRTYYRTKAPEVDQEPVTLQGLSFWPLDIFFRPLDLFLTLAKH